MLYFKIRLLELKKAYWQNKSRHLFMKYGRLEQFRYHSSLNPEWGFPDKDCIEVGTEDIKYYYVADSREGYKDLEHMLKLELKIRYK